MKFLFLLGLVFLDGAFGQMRSTWPPWARPGTNCLEYDGSKVPDCRLFVDPSIGEPYYHPHSSNCSRFWECGPDYESCLFECAHCGGSSNPLCNDQEALSFDPSFNYPVGPVCAWPSTIDCTNSPGECDCLPWQTCVGGKCIPQCEEDSDCPSGYECSDCKWCEGLTCTADSDCKHDMCNPPANPHTTCEYCDANTNGCVPGCPDDSLCPSSYPICGHGGGPHLCGCNANEDCAEDELCNTGSHECIPKPDEGCHSNGDCPSTTCDEPWPYNTCNYCDTDHVCKPGCPDDGKCPENKPICGANGQPHRCGCNVDSDCMAGDKCSNNACVTPDCTGDADCKDGICDVNNTPDYLECEFCEDGKCKPGCVDSSHCPNGYQCNAHICTADEGKALVKSIKVYSTSCTGCTTEGLVLTMNGRQDVVNKIRCKTNTLDHHNVNDYDGVDAVFDDKLTLGTYTPDGGCLSAPLDGAVSDSTWEWTGEGTWEGSSICVEWFGGDVYASKCTVVTGGKITDCEKVDGITCP